MTMRAGTFPLRGEMALRVGRNMSRLEDDLFTPEKIMPSSCSHSMIRA